MRQIVLDTETTGLETTAGHRIIEIGCVELIDRRITGRNWHYYLNPERLIETDATKIHGITSEFLRDKPRFAEIAHDLINFIRGSELLIHNAPFDVGFLDYELQLLDTQWGRIEDICQITDTLIMARNLYPGQKNNLDALCKRFGIDNSQRDLHGALLDANLLAQVYLAMTGGQVSLLLGGVGNHQSRLAPQRISPNRPRLLVPPLTDLEITAHQEKLAAIDKSSNGNCLWQRLNQDHQAIDLC